MPWFLPIVSIVVPFFGLTISILRNLKGNPKKELQWRLQVGMLQLGLLLVRFLVLSAPSLGLEGLP